VHDLQTVDESNTSSGMSLCLMLDELSRINITFGNTEPVEEFESGVLEMSVSAACAVHAAISAAAGSARTKYTDKSYADFFMEISGCWNMVNNQLVMATIDCT
jgi:hypothetical protein